MIPAMILAAGRSSRMGRVKAALPLGGETFLTRIVATFLKAGVDDVVVVAGHDAQVIAETIAASGLPARIVVNHEYDKGQLSSLQAGLSLVDRPGVVAALMTLVDVPLVSASTVRAVVDRYRQTHAPIVRPTQGERHGHPVLIDRALFDALRAESPAAGAKSIIRTHASPAGDVVVDDEGAFIDVDTPEEYERMVRTWIDDDDRPRSRGDR